jgi:hypothetical protein
VTESSLQRSDKSNVRALIALAPRLLLIAIVCCYILHLFTPLRLTPDAVAYLQMADSAASGNGFLVHGQRSYLPMGYPAIVSVLVKLNLTNPAFLIALNFAAAAVTAAVSWLLYRSVFGFESALATALSGLWLLSFVVLKHFAMPTTEMVFTAVVFLSLAAMDTAARSRTLPMCALMMCLAGLAYVLSVWIRAAGVALFPVLLLTAVRIFRTSWRGDEVLRPKRVAVAILPVVVVASGFSLYLLRSDTLETYARQAEKGGSDPSSVADRISYQLQEAGELFINGTSGKLPRWVPFQVLGVPLLAIIAATLYSRRRRIQLVDVFFVAYLALIFGWPFFDSRFWVPVVPVLAAYMAIFFTKMLPARATSIAGPAYAVLFVTAGFIAAAYSLWLTFSGERFPDRYGRGVMRAEYCSIFPCTNKDTLRPPDPDFVEVLRRYR